MSTISLLVYLVGYIVISYLLLYMAGEQQLISSDIFPYWLVVTASTVGYGDHAPATQGGKLAVALFIIPFGLSLFAIYATKAGLLISDIIQKGKRGLRMTSLKNHCAIIGWNEDRTLRLINLILAKQHYNAEPILLCVNQDIENPLPGKIDFVKVEAFTDLASMSRANLPSASRIIIDTSVDDVTLTTALFCRQQNPDCHKTAYFKDESVGELLRHHCPNVEVVPSVSIEMLACSSIDPGSSQFHKQLLDPTYGASQYSMVLDQKEPVSVEELAACFRENLRATLVGIRCALEDEITINPSLTTLVQPQSRIYYLADKRLGETFSTVSKGRVATSGAAQAG